MTQEEAKKKKVCTRCKWCRQEIINHTNWTEYVFKCTNNVVYLDPVTGDETYMSCSAQNKEGECEMFENIERSWIERIFDKLTGRRN